MNSYTTLQLARPTINWQNFRSCRAGGFGQPQETLRLLNEYWLSMEPKPKTTGPALLSLQFFCFFETFCALEFSRGESRSTKIDGCWTLTQTTREYGTIFKNKNQLLPSRSVGICTCFFWTQNKLFSFSVEEKNSSIFKRLTSIASHRTTTRYCLLKSCLYSGYDLRAILQAKK